MELSYQNTERLNEFMNGLEDLLNDAQCLEKDVIVSRGDNNSAKEKNFKAVSDFRKCINDYFDRLQRKVENEISQCHSQNEAILTAQLQTCLEVKETALIKQRKIDSKEQKKSTLHETIENFGKEVDMLKHTLNEASGMTRGPLYEFQKSDIIKNLISTEIVLGKVDFIYTGSDELTQTIHVHVASSQESLQSQCMPSQLSQKNKSGQPSCQINQPIRATEVKLHKAKEPWKPRRLKPGTSKKEVEGNDTAAEDLYKETECLLDMLTEQQFEAFESQIEALKIDTETKMKGVVDIVFEKAMSEPNICVAYAYMCRCISMIQVQSKQGKVINFRAMLLTRCQREFEMNNSSNPAFVTKHNEIAKHENKRKIEELKKELCYGKAKTKQRSLGNIRFIGELFKLKMISQSSMHECVFTLLRAKDPESLACVCMLLVTAGKELDTDNAKPRMDQHFKQMAKLANEKTTSARVRFMLQDVINIRLNKWIPRRSDNNLCIIDQLHREFIQEKQEQALPSQQLTFQKGDRSSPTFGQIVVGGSSQVHGWNKVGKQTALSSVDRSRDPPRITISKENVDESTQSFSGHKAGRFAGTGENSMVGNSIRARMKIAKSRTPAKSFSASREHIDRRTPGKQPAWIKGRGRGGVGRGSGDFGRPSNFSAELSQKQERLKAGNSTKSEEDFGRRIPRKSPTIGEGRGRAGFWRPPKLRTRLSQEQLNEDFDITKDGHSTPTPDIPLTEIADRLHDLIVVRREDNETIYNWIESNVDELTTAKSQFIRMLMTAVCQSAIKGEKGKEKLEPKDIIIRNDLLQKYLDHKPVFELQALFALQLLVARLEHPQGLLQCFFDVLYDEDIINEDAFIEWEESVEEPEGKRTALKQVVHFFQWLKETEEES